MENPAETVADNLVGQKLVNEFVNRRNYAKNIIVYNFSAPASNNSEIDEFNVLLKSIVSCSPAKSVFRFGKSLNNKPRPLKVIFDNEADASLVLKNAAKFAKKNLIVKNDLTLNQRRYLQSVRKDLNRRILDGESDLPIKYVDNIPTIVPKPKNA